MPLLSEGESRWYVYPCATFSTDYGPRSRGLVGTGREAILLQIRYQMYLVVYIFGVAIHVRSRPSPIDSRGINSGHLWTLNCCQCPHVNVHLWSRIVLSPVHEPLDDADDQNDKKCDHTIIHVISCDGKVWWEQKEHSRDNDIGDA